MRIKKNTSFYWFPHCNIKNPKGNSIFNGRVYSWLFWIWVFDYKHDGVVDILITFNMETDKED